MNSPQCSNESISQAIREHWGFVTASLIARYRDIELAEDATQEAALRAVETWSKQGLPNNPRAWLLTTATNVSIDYFRKVKSERRYIDAQQRKTQNLSNLAADPQPEGSNMDHRLELIFTCCHPALNVHAQIALTLHTLGGLTTQAIAKTFIVPETTMAQRLVRAKRKVKLAGIPFKIPDPNVWPGRLDTVLKILYLIFNEGYSPSNNRHSVREDLCLEAIRLTRMLYSLTRQNAEVGGLLALMLLHDSRKLAREDTTGTMVPLQHQDRSLWNRPQIKEGDEILKEALTRGEPGPYQIQASISAIHCLAASHDSTDWPQIVWLYRTLNEMCPSPIVILNECVALSYASTAQAGLQALLELDSLDTLSQYQPMHAALADLYFRVGDIKKARQHYRTAIDLTKNEADRKFLDSKLRALEE